MGAFTIRSHWTLPTRSVYFILCELDLNIKYIKDAVFKEFIIQGKLYYNAKPKEM